MKMERKTMFVLLLALIALVVSVWLVMGTLRQREAARVTVIGNMERIKVVTHQKTETITAKIDTGAESSSIDEDLARSVGLRFGETPDRVITGPLGTERRDTVKLTFVLADRTISTVATVSDRSDVSGKVLIGRNDLQGFVVDANKSFLTEPGETKRSFLFRLSSAFTETGSELIIIVPILGAFVVFLRLMIGIRTYGIFAPVVIAVSLMEIGLMEGMLIYLFLILVGVTAKIFILNRFQMPHIGELSLIMFTSVIVLVGISLVPFDSTFRLTTTFFPLIITSYLIERFTRTVEEYRIGEALPLLFVTLLAALAAALFGRFLADFSFEELAVIFIVALLAVLAMGYYEGLRLSEIFRFKFLREK